MKQSISKSEFKEAFRKMGRVDSYSCEGLGALYDYILEHEESCGEEVELDVIGLCCEYSEDSIENVLESYSLKSIEELRDNTQVVWEDGVSVLYLEY